MYLSVGENEVKGDMSQIRSGMVFYKWKYEIIGEHKDILDVSCLGDELVFERHLLFIRVYGQNCNSWDWKQLLAIGRQSLSLLCHSPPWDEGLKSFPFYELLFMSSDQCFR